MKVDVGNGDDVLERSVPSYLWDNATNFVHNSWIELETDFQQVSTLGRRMLVSSLLEDSEILSSESHDFAKLGVVKRFVQAPVRCVLIAGISANPVSKHIRCISDPKIRKDAEFAMTLCSTFSMKERYEFLNHDTCTAMQIGVQLFYQNVFSRNESIWRICRYALDKRLVGSIDYGLMDGADVHSAALEAAWMQIDRYLVDEQRELTG